MEVYYDVKDQADKIEVQIRQMNGKSFGKPIISKIDKHKHVVKLKAHFSGQC